MQRGGAFHGFSQAGLVHRLEEIVDGAGFECFNGVLIEGGDDHDNGQSAAIEISNYVEAAHDRHLEVQEHQVGLKLGDLFQGLAAVLGLADYLDLGKLLQFFAEDPTGDWFIVDDQGLHVAHALLGAAFTLL